MKSYDDFVKEASQYKQILINYKDKKQVFADCSFHPNTNINETKINFQNGKYKWMRIDEIYRAPLFQNNLIKPEFISRGDFDDLNLLCAFTQIAKQPEIIHNFFDCETVESILGKEKNSINLKCGAVVIYLYAFGRKTPVLVDTMIPFYKGKRRPILSRPTDINKSAWFCLIEKAIAKLSGSFSNYFQLGYSHIIYNIFNYYTDILYISKIEGDKYAKMLQYQKDFVLMSAVSYASEPLPVSQEELALKGIDHHYYSIIKVQQCQGKNFICLRNPWENDKEWLGDYSDNSSLWTPQLKEELGMKASNDGTFWMIDKDFFKYFNGIQISGPIWSNLIIRQFTYHFTPGSHDGQPFNSPAARIGEMPNYALQITGQIKPNQQVNIRILIEKRNLVGPNIRSQYMILLGKSNGKKLTPDIVRYTFRYTLTHDLFSFSYPIDNNNQIITIAMHRLSKCNITEDCYVQIMCDVDFKLYNIDNPSKPIPRSENHEIIFKTPKKSVEDTVKQIIIPPKIIKNESNENAENEKENDDFKLLKKMADAGDVDAMFECSEILQYGDGVERDMKEALRYCKMAIDKGSAKAMYKYALNYELGDGVTANKNEALKYFIMAANKGIVKAMVKCAEMMSNGEGVAINKKEAAKYYQMAANKGESLSMYNLAVMLSNGDGIPENKAEAAKYYKMAADKNDIDAMYRYAEIMRDGDEGVDENPEEAFKYFKKAADQGDLESIKNCAEMLEDGIGVDENKVEAAKYYEIAANEGDVQSMFYAAVLYDDDEEIPSDLRKSAKYYKMAADQGHRESMYFYGVKLNIGDGVDINKEEAKKYIKRSAEKGYERAIEYLKKNT